MNSVCVLFLSIYQAENRSVNIQKNLDDVNLQMSNTSTQCNQLKQDLTVAQFQITQLKIQQQQQQQSKQHVLPQVQELSHSSIPSALLEEGFTVLQRKYNKLKIDYNTLIDKYESNKKDLHNQDDVIESQRIKLREVNDQIMKLHNNSVNRQRHTTNLREQHDTYKRQLESMSIELQLKEQDNVALTLSLQQRQQQREIERQGISRIKQEQQTDLFEALPVKEMPTSVPASVLASVPASAPASASLPQSILPGETEVQVNNVQ